MNQKVIITAAALLVAAAVFLFTRKDSGVEEGVTPPTDKVESVTREAPAPLPSTTSPVKKEALSKWDLPKARVSPHATDTEEHREWIAEQVADLQDKSWFFDEPEILQAVMADLRSPEPQLRTAALEAVINLGSRDAVPYLESAAALADTPEEQKALIEAAEYLKLPTIFETKKLREAMPQK